MALRQTVSLSGSAAGPSVFGGRVQFLDEQHELHSCSLIMLISGNQLVSTAEKLSTHGALLISNKIMWLSTDKVT